MSQYFPQPQQISSQNVKIELDLYNYATKLDLKRATIIYTYTLGLKADMTSLKTKVDNLDLDKPKAIASDFIKLSNLKDTEIFKKTTCYRLVVWQLLLILRYQALVDYPLKQFMIHTNRALKKN